MVSPSRASVAMLAAAVLVGCGSAPVSVAVPNVVGQALDAAKATLVTVGFAADSQDLLRDRNPLLDSDWTVCTQSPGPMATAGTTVDLGVVKKAETCPAAAGPAGAAPTTPAAQPVVENPEPAPKPHPQPAPSTESARQPARATSGSGTGSSSRTGGTGTGAGSGGSAVVGTVRSGTFCDPPATGVSGNGTPMVCAPASDGRNRWRRA